jgi:hypothetical protein
MQATNILEEHAAPILRVTIYQTVQMTTLWGTNITDDIHTDTITLHTKVMNLEKISVLNLNCDLLKLQSKRNFH